MQICYLRSLIVSLPPANEVWGKVMFYSCLSVHGGGGLPSINHMSHNQPPGADPPISELEKRPVRILLGCFLVFAQFSSFKNKI